MGILQVVWFGGIRLTRRNWLTEVTITRKVQTLLAYLLLQCHRALFGEVLACVFLGFLMEPSFFNQRLYMHG